MRRKIGFLLFSMVLILTFVVVRAIPPDWEIGPFQIVANGNADSQAGLYFSDDAQAPIWLLVPTFNLPSRFFAARPNSSSRPLIAMGPSVPAPSSTDGAAIPSPSDSATPSSSPSPSSTNSPQAGPSPSPSLTAGPTPTPTSQPTPTSTPTPTPTSRPTPTPTPTPLPLRIVTASEAIAFSGNPSTKCKLGTVSATGRVTTNGVAGTVTYQWRHLDTNGTLVSDGGTSSGSIRVSAGTTTYIFTDTLTPQTSGSEQLVLTNPSDLLSAQSLACRS